ncbi:MAG: LemA family protein [Thermodesulfobacteriota bacterium]
MRNSQSSKTLGRVIELSFCFLAALVVLMVVSFLTLRPLLIEFRTDAQNEWESYVAAVSKRNEVLPGLAEALRGFEPGHGKLVNKLLQAPSVPLLRRDPDFIVAFADDIELSLLEIEKLAKAGPQLTKYPPFAAHWLDVSARTQRVTTHRAKYNKAATAYNGLLSAFPQNLVCGVWGFVRLNVYPAPGILGSAK